MKFNQGMYAKMRAKKNEPLSTLRVRTVRIVKKGVSITPITPGTETTRIASLATSIEKIAPLRKKQCVANKGKNKADSRSSSVWDDAGLVLVRAQEAFTAEELKAFSGISSNEVVGRHLHKLVQVVYLCKFILSFFFFLHCSEVWVLISSTGESFHITWKYLTQEAKVAFVVSRVEALEVENSKLKKDLIAAIDEANTFKEKAKVLGDDLRAERQLTLEKDEQLQAAKEKIKTVTVKAVKAFQQTKKYNTVLFSWYYKGFKLLRWYLVKHPSGVDMENLDLEVVDQDKASQSTIAAPAGDAPRDAPLPPSAGDDAISP